MQSETIGKLAEALAKAQGMMTAAAKDGKANYGKYATLDSVWDAARKPLSANNLAVVQSTDITPSGEMVMITTLMHSSGEWVGSVYPVRPVQSTPQGIGSALTYARRYSLSALVGLTADDDDDGNEASGKQSASAQHAQRQPAKPATQANGDNPFEDDKPSPTNGNSATEKQHKMLFALGSKLYGDGWNAKRPELVKAITKGRSESSSDLTGKEMSTLLDGLKKKEGERDAIADITLATVPEMAH